MRLPDFVVIGAQKSASTALAQSLRRHPQIYMPVGETHYFRDPEYGRASSIQDLANEFPNASESRRRGIKCPDYLGQAPVAERIHSALGSVDNIAVLRNPVERAISHYYWLVRWGQLPVEPIDVGMRRILDGEYDQLRWANELLKFGLYGEHIERYRKVFTPEHLFVLLDSDLRTDMRGTLSRAFAFLKVDPNFEVSVPRRQRNEGIYEPRRLAFVRRRNRFVYDDGDPMTGTMRRPSRPMQALPNAAVVLVDRYVLAPLLGNAKESLDIGLRKELRAYYSDDIRKTEGLIGRDLSSWLS